MNLFKEFKKMIYKYLVFKYIGMINNDEGHEIFRIVESEKINRLENEISELNEIIKLNDSNKWVGRERVGVLFEQLKETQKELKYYRDIESERKDKLLEIQTQFSKIAEFKQEQEVNRFDTISDLEFPNTSCIEFTPDEGYRYLTPSKIHSLKFSKDRITKVHINNEDGGLFILHELDAGITPVYKYQCLYSIFMSFDLILVDVTDKVIKIRRKTTDEHLFIVPGMFITAEELRNFSDGFPIGVNDFFIERPSDSFIKISNTDVTQWTVHYSPHTKIELNGAEDIDGLLGVYNLTTSFINYIENVLIITNSKNQDLRVTIGATITDEELIEFSSKDPKQRPTSYFCINGEFINSIEVSKYNVLEWDLNLANGTLKLNDIDEINVLLEIIGLTSNYTSFDGKDFFLISNNEGGNIRITPGMIFSDVFLMTFTGKGEWESEFLALQRSLTHKDDTVKLMSVIINPDDINTWMFIFSDNSRLIKSGANTIVNTMYNDLSININLFLNSGELFNGNSYMTNRRHQRMTLKPGKVISAKKLYAFSDGSYQE